MGRWLLALGLVACSPQPPRPPPALQISYAEPTSPTTWRPLVDGILPITRYVNGAYGVIVRLGADGLEDDPATSALVSVPASGYLTHGVQPVFVGFCGDGLRSVVGTLTDVDLSLVTNPGDASIVTLASSRLQLTPICSTADPACEVTCR